MSQDVTEIAGDLNTGRRRGGRERSAESRGPRLPEQIPYRQPYMRLNHTDVVSADELESIHEASIEILERIGLPMISYGGSALMTTLASLGILLNVSENVG